MQIEEFFSNRGDKQWQEVLQCALPPSAVSKQRGWHAEIRVSVKFSKWPLVTSHRRCGDRAGPWGCGSDPGRCCRPGTACLSDAPLGWCALPRASPWRRTFRAADDESTQPAERPEGEKCHECHFQAWECSANLTQQVPGTKVNKAV